MSTDKSMKKHYKRVAWLLDDGIFLEGYIEKRNFIPDNKGCGFSCQKIRRKDIGKILFYNKEDVTKTGLEVIKESDCIGYKSR